MSCAYISQGGASTAIALDVPRTNNIAPPCLKLGIAETRYFKLISLPSVSTPESKSANVSSPILTVDILVMVIVGRFTPAPQGDTGKTTSVVYWSKAELGPFAEIAFLVENVDVYT